MDGDIIDSKNYMFNQKEDPYGHIRQDFSKIFSENNLGHLANPIDIGFIDTDKSHHHRAGDNESIGFHDAENPFMKISHKEDYSPNPKALFQMGYSPATYLAPHIGFKARDLFSAPGKNTSETFGLTPSRAMHKFADDEYPHYDGQYMRTPSDQVDNFINDIPLSLMWGHDSGKAFRKKLATTPSDFFNQKAQPSFGVNFVPPVYRGAEFDDEEMMAKDDDIEDPDHFQKLYQNNHDKEQLELAKLFVGGKIEATPSNSTMTTAQKTSNTSSGSAQKAFRTPNKIKIKEEFRTAGKSTPQSKGRDIDDDDDDGPGSEHRSSRGLRVLSVKVKDIVGEKKKTSYKEVADDLIAEFSNKLKLKKSGESKDEQNVKRRVYDALNVLIAADILKKDGKTVFCDESLANIGAPQRRRLKEEKDDIEHEIHDASRRKKKKLETIRELISKCLAIKSLVKRNMENLKVEASDEHHEKLVIHEEKDTVEEKENKNSNVDPIKEEQDDSKSNKRKAKKMKAKGKENEIDNLKVEGKSGEVVNTTSEEQVVSKLAEDEIIRFPFIVVVSNATENAMNLNMNNGQRQLSIESKNSFDLFGDIDILLKMRLHHVSEEFFNENIPPQVQKYVIRADS